MLTKVLAFAVLAATALAQYTINTPAALTECQPSLITWVGGQAPFILSAIPAGQTGAAAIANIAEGINANQFSWTVNLPVNTALTLKLVDATGNTAYTSPLTVFKGSSTACLTGGGSSGGASSGAPAASSSGAPAASSSGAPAASSSGAPAGTTSSGAPAGTSAAPAASSGGASASAGGATTSSVSHAASGSGAASGSTSAAPSASASKPSSAARTAVAALPLVAAGVAAAYFL
ncbi:uncharacterized protein LOC62_03G005177 [Vanrija pseudolonga]|uniref:Uncharacterized protein n=1 Tax=Vanrija pseudolonga TaxID=143232 RepID=A0AAF0YD34_9TREE|nr:hypothetical protein LOC62_03G005177 [Vanrija pseudolonga]